MKKVKRLMVSAGLLSIFITFSLVKVCLTEEKADALIEEMNLAATVSKKDLRIKPNLYLELFSKIQDLGPSDDFVDAHTQYLEYLKSEDIKVFGDTGRHSIKGQGIIIIGKGNFSFPVMMVILQLRALGSKLPVEVFMHAADKDDTSLCSQVLPDLNARCIYLDRHFPQTATGELTLTKEQLKPFAFFASHFETILFLDADTMPVKNPDHFLNSQPFTSTGLVTWSSDVGRSTHFSVFNLTESTEQLPQLETDGNVMMIDKRKHAQTLYLALYYSIHGPSHYHGLFSERQGGDQVFVAASHVLNASYYQMRRPFQQIGDSMAYFDVDLDYHKKEEETPPENTRLVFLRLSQSRLIPYTLAAVLVNQEGVHRRLYDGSTPMAGYDVERQVWELFTQALCEKYTPLEDSPVIKQGWIGMRLQDAQRGVSLKECEVLQIPHLEFLRHDA